MVWSGGFDGNPWKNVVGGVEEITCMQNSYLSFL